MIRGLYAAASGMMMQADAQEVIAHNLANVATPGYRRRHATAATFPRALDAAVGRNRPAQTGRLHGGVETQQVSVDFHAGALRPTERAFDLALRGDGWFALLTAQGMRYTRDGRFRLNAEQQLVGLDGDPVMGTGGPITLPSSDLSVDGNGQVFSDGHVAGQLFIAAFDDPAQLQPTGPGQFAASVGPRESTSTEVVQGHLEQPNFAPVTELVRMISGYRLYEANQRALTMQDGTLDALLNRVAG